MQYWFKVLLLLMVTETVLSECSKGWSISFIAVLSLCQFMECFLKSILISICAFIKTQAKFRISWNRFVLENFEILGVWSIYQLQQLVKFPFNFRHFLLWFLEIRLHLQLWVIQRIFVCVCRLFVFTYEFILQCQLHWHYDRIDRMFLVKEYQINCWFLAYPYL